MTKLLTVAGGSCTDVTAPYIAVRYACEDTAAKCQGRKPFTTYVCRDSKNPNIIRERRLHYLHGWAAAHVDFRDRLPPGKTRRGPFAWVHFDAPGRPASLEYSRIVSGNPVTLYRVCEGLRYINIRVDDSAIDVPSNRKCLDVAGKTVDLSLRDKSNAKYAKPQYYILEE